MIETIGQALQFDFMRHALLAGVLVSIACGIIGTFVVVNRIVFISGG
ncbi:metal ABC transporter permease, partial [Leptolyngbyaceae cyanobacterium CCMR0082]